MLVGAYAGSRLTPAPSDRSPYEALRIATRDAAEFAGVLDSIGTIEPRRLADFVVLDANPLVDIRNARRIRVVVLQGRVLSADTLRQRLYPAKAPGG